MMELLTSERLCDGGPDVTLRSEDLPDVVVKQADIEVFSSTQYAYRDSGCETSPRSLSGLASTSRSNIEFYARQEEHGVT